VKVRVVSFPCWELFAEQSKKYQQSVVPKRGKKLRVYVEACSTSFGLDKYADLVISMESFGASAPGAQLKSEFGFTVENVVEKVVAAYNCGEDTDDEEYSCSTPQPPLPHSTFHLPHLAWNAIRSWGIAHAGQFKNENLHPTA